MHLVHNCWFDLERGGLESKNQGASSSTSAYRSLPLRERVGRRSYFGARVSFLGPGPGGVIFCLQQNSQLLPFVLWGPGKNGTQEKTASTEKRTRRRRETDEKKKIKIKNKRGGKKVYDVSTSSSNGFVLVYFFYWISNKF